MHWNLRFIRMANGHIHLVEVCYHGDGSLMGYCEPFLLGNEPDWPQVLSTRVSAAAALPVLAEGDFPIEVGG